ncbi:NAD(P)H-binding protein [Jatrophihabitans telluris]|uniref:NAD(P)H-binding protein n=1 Tax=Jatrophihabitans telluris TaxID=2038343 RepID=A0ABY4QV37_9ACTN|nr:NAD(P)H-binding protein [Jatrophihabitans telluris]UQX87513.1 NAD(P)H-binding protein [Jatrophihabitans telluris]
MKIAVIGGTGMVGSRVVAEAATRGHQVTAVSRKGDAQASDQVTPVRADATDPGVLADLGRLAADHDVVVSAIGPSREPDGDPAAFSDTLVALAGAVKPTRLLVVGGAGSLLAAPGVRLVDTPDFPQAYKAESLAAAASLEALRSLPDSGEWVYLSPAPVIAPGTRTGRYAVSDETPAGEHISAEDFAVALIDEIERPAHHNTRFTVAN